jgi:ArsR family transcriptional regulator
VNPRTASEIPSVFVHRRNAEEARKGMHEPGVIRGLGQIFKVLGDETRLRICLVLARHELCVNDIAGLVGLSESGISHQLRLLKALRLVTYRREGKMTYYMLDDEHVEELIRLGVRHVSE